MMWCDVWCRRQTNELHCIATTTSYVPSWFVPLSLSLFRVSSFFSLLSVFLSWYVFNPYPHEDAGKYQTHASCWNALIYYQITLRTTLIYIWNQLLLIPSCFQLSSSQSVRLCKFLTVDGSLFIGSINESTVPGLCSWLPCHTLARWWPEWWTSLACVGCNGGRGQSTALLGD